MPDTSRHSTIDLLALPRALCALPTALLVACGAALGIGVAATDGARHQASVSWSLSPLVCPATPGATAAPAFDRFRLAATAIEGLGVRPPKVPSHLEGSLITCAVREQAAAAKLDCVVESDSESEALRLARLADSKMRESGSPLANAVAEARILGGCGPKWVEAQELEPAGTRSIHDSLPPSAALRALRDATALPAAGLKPVKPGASNEPKRAPPVLFGAISGLLAAMLLAAWRSRTRHGAAEPRSESRLATVALAGLMLTPSMDRVLVLAAGPFTLRAGQLSALLLLAVLLAPRLRSGSARLPASAVLASLLYLFIASLSSIWSGNPLKSAGYLAWAGFDLVAVLGGIALYADTELRFERSLKLWFAGLALAAGMGALQLGMWTAIGSAPLLYGDGHGLPRLNGFSYEPSYFALYLVPGALALATRFAFLGRPAWRHGLLAALLLLTVAISTSRSGWLGTACGLVIVAMFVLRRLGRKALPRLLSVAGALSLAAALSLACWPQLRVASARFARMALDRNEVSSSRPRLDSMVQAARLFERSPLLGVGFGSYGAFVERHPELHWHEGKDTHAVVTTNLWLEIAAETGALGLLAAVALIAALLWPLGRRDDPGLSPLLASARAGLLAGALTAFLVLFQFSQTLWRLDIWVLLGLSFASALLSKRRREAPQQADGGSPQA